MTAVGITQVTITYLCREDALEDSYTQFLSRIARIREFFPQAMLMYSTEPEYVGDDGSDDLYTQLAIERHGVVDGWEMYRLIYVVRMTREHLDTYADLFFLDPPEGRDTFPAFLMFQPFAFTLDQLTLAPLEGEGMVAAPPPFREGLEQYY